MAKNKDKKELAPVETTETNLFARPGEEAVVETVEPVVKQTESTKSEEVRKVMKTEVTKTSDRAVPFYYGYYSVNHPTRKGELMEPLHSITGETRKCPCYSIAIKLENAILLVENGYILKNLDTKLFKGKSISKRNLDDYVTYITNMINNGFLK